MIYIAHSPSFIAAAAASPGTEQSGFVHDAYRDSSDIMRMKSSVALDRKLSATARLPKRSTIVESPSGRVVQPTDVQHSQRSQENQSNKQQQQQPILYNTPATPTTPTLRQPQPRNPGTTPLLQAQQSRGQAVGGQATWQQHQQSSSSPSVSDQRPAFNQNSSNVYIVDEHSAPTSPSQEESPRTIPRGNDEGLTLADIPQLMEVEQAREQRRSLPRQGGKPLIAELSPLELAIIKHASVLTLSRSTLKDQFDLDEILDMVEVKKSGFWGKLFKGGADKKNVKKKGKLYSHYYCFFSTHFFPGGVFGVPLEQLVERQGADSILGVSREPLRVPSFIDDVVSAMRQMGAYF